MLPYKEKTERVLTNQHSYPPHQLIYLAFHQDYTLTKKIPIIKKTIITKGYQ